MKFNIVLGGYIRFGLVFIGLLLASCSSELQEGQIRGILLRDGEPFENNQIALAINAEGKDINDVEMLYITTDEKGAFECNDCPAGEYWILYPQISFTAGLTLEAVLQDGEIFSFTLPEGLGIDVGTIDVKSTKRVY